MKMIQSRVTLNIINLQLKQILKFGFVFITICVSQFSHISHVIASDIEDFQGKSIEYNVNNANLQAPHRVSLDRLYISVNGSIFLSTYRCSWDVKNKCKLQKAESSIYKKNSYCVKSKYVIKVCAKYQYDRGLLRLYSESTYLDGRKGNYETIISISGGKCTVKSMRWGNKGSWDFTAKGTNCRIRDGRHL